MTAVDPPGWSPRPRRHPSVAVLLHAGLTLACLETCLLPSGPAAWVAGLALVLVLPGDALRRACGPALARTDPVVSTVALSLAVTVLVGMGADRLDAGITKTTMLAGLAGIALLADLAALIRSLRNDHVQGEVTAPARRWGSFALVALAFAAPTSVAFAIAVQSAHQQNADSASTALSIAEPSAGIAAIQIDNPGRSAQEYDLAVTAGDHELSHQTLKVAGGASASVTVSTVGVPPSTRVTAMLTRSGDMTPLRTVWMVSSSSAGPAR